ncbi:MAG: hypothetical protein J6M02_07425 [Clostridia bacterium]|nr:hypothetical protein [Clostridia bacterium]
MVIYKNDTLDEVIKPMQVERNLSYNQLKSFYSNACKVAGNYVSYYELEGNRTNYMLADIDNDGLEDILIDYNWGSIDENEVLF